MRTDGGKPTDLIMTHRERCYLLLKVRRFVCKGCPSNCRPKKPSHRRKPDGAGLPLGTKTSDFGLDLMH